MKAKLNSLEQLQPSSVSMVAPPPMEAEPPHQRLARLNREAERIVKALQELKKSWAERNLKAQATRQAIATAELTQVANRRRELAGELLKVQTEIGATNKEIRERKAGGSAGASPEAAPARNGTRSKKCSLREHAAFDQYFRLAAENELESRLYAKVEAAAKSMLSHALKTGVEEF